MLVMTISQAIGEVKGLFTGWTKYMRCNCGFRLLKAVLKCERFIEDLENCRVPCPKMPFF